MASKAIEVIGTNVRLCLEFLFGNMTLLFVKSYKNEALYELQVEAVPRIQLCGQFPPLRLHECVHSHNALCACSSETCPLVSKIRKDFIFQNPENRGKFNFISEVKILDG